MTRAKHFIDEGLPGYSQARLLLFLAEHGPATVFRARWRSRAATATWDGTLRWCRAHDWLLLDDGVLAVTEDGMEALRRRAGWHADIRANFRPAWDRYWNDLERGTDEWEGFPPEPLAGGVEL